MRILPFALLACHRGPDGGPSSGSVDTTSPVDSGPVRVFAVTPTAPPGGLITASLVDSLLEPRVFLGPVELEWAWTPGSKAIHRVWRVPRSTPVGLSPLTFAFPDGGRDELDLEVAEPWFESVTDRVGLTGDQIVDGWDPDCAQSLTGIGVGDIDDDGDFDLLRGHLTAPSQLFENVGDSDGDGLPNFVDATDAFGLGGQDYVVSVNFADYDNDGDTDLFLGRRGVNRLFRNQLVESGTASMVNVLGGSGLSSAEQRTTGGGWGDYDNDGDLDLYEVNHTWCFPGHDDGDTRNAHHLYRNDGGGHFVDVTTLLATELEQTDRFGFAAIWLDLDRDGDQDLWVVNDLVESGGKSVVWRNDGLDTDTGRWQFVDIGSASGIAPALDALGKGVNAMGGAVGDVDHDGYPDFAFTNIGPNGLMLSGGGGGTTWVDAADARDVERTTLPWADNSVTWGVNLWDVDLDADLDVLYVGGPIHGPELQPHALFENLGAGPMVDRTWESGVATIEHGGASVQVDLDGDGFLDLLVSNWADQVDVYHNLLGARHDRHWLTVDPRGDGAVVNRDGFGAVVELVRLDGSVQTCFKNPMPSMSAAGDPGCHFGIAADAAVDEVRVHWPDGATDRIDAPRVDRRLEVVRAP